MRSLTLWRLLLALVLTERIHHGGDAFLLCLRPLRVPDLPHIFFLVRERELGPELPSLGVAGNDPLEVSGYIDRTFAFIDCHEHADGITGLALSAGAQLGVDHHHMSIAHIHQ